MDINKMTLAEYRRREEKELLRVQAEWRKALEQALRETLSESIQFKILGISNDEDGFSVGVWFRIDGVGQTERFHWAFGNMKDFVSKIRGHVGHVHKLRTAFPESCKHNDYIQANRWFEKKVWLKHGGASYANSTCTIECNLAKRLDLSKDTEIMQTPKRVEEFNENIDKVIQALIESIVELKGRKLDATD